MANDLGTPRKVFLLFVDATCFGALLYGSYSFMESAAVDLQALGNFVPFCVILLYKMTHSFVSVTQVDPVTFFFLLVSSGLLLGAMFVDAARAEKPLQGGVGILTFIAGYEVGRLRGKAQE